MRRRLPWILPALLLVVLAAGYAAYWFYVAELVRQGIVDWIEARRQEGYSVGTDRIGVSGFPFTIRARLDGAVMAQDRAQPGWELRIPVLVGEALPWSPDRWTLAGERGGRLHLDPGPARPSATIEAARLGGRVAPTATGEAAAGGTTVEVTGDDVTVQAEQRLRIARAAVSAALPAKARVGHLEIWSRAALQLDQVTLPTSAGPLGQTVDQLALTAAVKGSVPPGTLRDALARWRDDGGTLELESFRLAWGRLLAVANGTLALDEQLQPIGSLSATIQGQNEILDSLAAAGTMKSGDAQLAKIALGLLAKPGSDGRPQIAAPVRIQNSEVYLGPARIARLPRFTWE
jgi:hypothetical protein